MAVVVKNKTTNRERVSVRCFKLITKPVFFVSRILQNKPTIISDCLYQYYKKRIKKFVPQKIFRTIDLFFLILDKLIFSINRLDLKKDKYFNQLINPKITIGISSYNHSRYLEQCIESALAQDYDHFKIVIVDDCSTDTENRDILKKYEHNPKIKIIYKEKNEGISVSLNDQVINANNNWIAFLDCDDYLPPNALSEMAKYIKKNPQMKLIFSNRIEVDRNNKFLRKILFRNRYVQGNMFNELLKGMVSSHLKMIHRDAFLKVGLFDERFDGTQDYDMFLRIAFYLPEAFGFIDKYLYFHRIHDDQNTLIEKDKHKENVKKIIKEALSRRDIYAGKFRSLISVIILSFNRGDDTKKAVEKILKFTKNLVREIIILDNGSNDKKTLDILTELKKNKELKVLFYETNLGASGGRKICSKIARGEFLYFIDNDVEVSQNAVEELIIRLNEDPTIAGVCSKVLFPNNKIQFNGGNYSPRNGFINFTLTDLGKNKCDLSAMSKLECRWIPGGATMIRKEVFDQAEFDTSFINAFEDNDLSLQITKKLNLRLVNCPTSVVMHNHYNFIIFQDAGTKKYAEARYQNDFLIRSWAHFYQKWGLIIDDHDIIFKAGLFQKNDQEIKNHLDNNLSKINLTLPLTTSKL